MPIFISISGRHEHIARPGGVLRSVPARKRRREKSGADAAFEPPAAVDCVDL